MHARMPVPADFWLRRACRRPRAPCTSGSPGSTAGTCRPGARRPPLAARAGARAQRLAGALPAEGAPRAPAPAHGMIRMVGRLTRRAPNKPERHGTGLHVRAVAWCPLYLRARHSAWRKGTPGTQHGAKGSVRRLEQRSPTRRLRRPRDPAPGPDASREGTSGAGQGPPTNLDQGGRLKARRGMLHKRQRERVKRGRGQEALGLHGQRSLRSAEHACLGRLPRSTPCTREACSASARASH